MTKFIFTALLALSFVAFAGASEAGTSYADKKQGRVPFDNAAEKEADADADAEAVADIEPAAGADQDVSETIEEEAKEKSVADDIKLPRKR